MQHVNLGKIQTYSPYELPSPWERSNKHIDEAAGGGETQISSAALKITPSVKRNLRFIIEIDDSIARILITYQKKVYFCEVVKFT